MEGQVRIEQRLSEMKGRVMRVASGSAAVLFSALLVSGPAHGQTIEAGGLTGDIVSATAAAPFETTTTVLFVPVDSTYILTQACLTSGGMALPPTLSGSVLGDFLMSGGCTVFTPGLAFQPGELITLTGQPLPPFPGPASDSTALITGVLVKSGSEEDD